MGKKVTFDLSFEDCIYFATGIHASFTRSRGKVQPQRLEMLTSLSSMRLELVTHVRFAFRHTHQGLEFVKQLNIILNNSGLCCTHVSSFKTFAGNIIYIAFNPIQVLFGFLQLFLGFLQRNSYGRHT